MNHARVGIGAAPDDPGLHSEVAVNLMAARRLQEALTEASIALYLDDSVEAYWQLAARLCFKLQEWTEAVICLERLAALSLTGARYIEPFLAAARQAASINYS